MKIKFVWEETEKEFEDDPFCLVMPVQHKKWFISNLPTGKHKFIFWEITTDDQLPPPLKSLVARESYIFFHKQSRLETITKSVLKHIKQIAIEDEKPTKRRKL